MHTGPSHTTVNGRYHLLARLAIGGMAEIFLARELGLEGFQRMVVIKRILPHLAAQPKYVEMFLREARIIARFNHPNITHVHELCAHEGDYHIVMEYVRGCTLRELCVLARERDRAVPHNVAVSLLIDACRGLHAAHELRDDDGRSLELIHRDISPHNLMTTMEGHLKLIDFGVAKTNIGSESTYSGQLKGKFAYMSPEQCLYKSLDRRSDVFALGIVLWELCTAESLFRRESELETLQAVADARVQPPSHLNPDLPLPVEAVIMKALAKDPDARFASAEEMRVALAEAARDCGLRADQDAVARFVREIAGERINARHDQNTEGSFTPTPSLDSVDEPITVAARPSAIPQPITAPLSSTESSQATPLPGFSPESTGLSAPQAPETEVTPPEPEVTPPEPEVTPPEPSPVKVPSGSPRVWLFLLLPLLLMFAWRFHTESQSTTPPPDAPPHEHAAPLLTTSVTIGWPPVIDPALLKKELEPLRRYLEVELGQSVTFVYTDSYSALGHALVNRSLHFGVMTPLLFLQTDDRVSLEPIVSREFDGSLGSDAYLFASEDSSIQTIEEARGKRFCFTNPKSTSGYLMPRAFIRSRGHDPDTFIGEVRWSGDHFQGLEDLLQGRCDVTATYSGAWLTAHNTGLLVSKLRLIEVVGYIPQDTVSAGPLSTPEMRLALRDALVRFDPRAVTGEASLGKTQRITGFRVPKDDVFDELELIWRLEQADKTAKSLQLSAIIGSLRSREP